MKRMFMELDKDGLPVRTAYSAGELARLAGVRENTINCAISHYKRKHKDNRSPRGRKQRWCVVDLEESE